MEEGKKANLSSVSTQQLLEVRFVQCHQMFVWLWMRSLHSFSTHEPQVTSILTSKYCTHYFHLCVNGCLTSVSSPCTSFISLLSVVVDLEVGWSCLNLRHLGLMIAVLPVWEYKTGSKPLLTLTFSVCNHVFLWKVPAGVSGELWAFHEGRW